MKSLKFEVTQRSYSIEIDDESFLDLIDSESYVTENAAYQKGVETLSQKLNKLPGVWDADYNGHFGAAIYLKIDVDDDTEALQIQIGEIIEKHLKWCAGLPKRKDVLQRRAA